MLRQQPIFVSPQQETHTVIGPYLRPDRPYGVLMLDPVEGEPGFGEPCRAGKKFPLAKILCSDRPGSSASSNWRLRRDEAYVNITLCDVLLAIKSSGKPSFTPDDIQHPIPASWSSDRRRRPRSSVGLEAVY